MRAGCGSLGVSPGLLRTLTSAILGLGSLGPNYALALRASLVSYAGCPAPGSPLAYGFKDGLSAAFAAVCGRGCKREGATGWGCASGTGPRAGCASGTGPRAAERPRRSRGAFGPRGPVPFNPVTDLLAAGVNSSPNDCRCNADEANAGESQC